jgi:HAD superfamily hydrolase (TIGR01549 family)
VGGVFRDSKIVMNQCFKDAFQKYNISIDLDVNSLYHLRGLETFNSLFHSCKALYVTKGKDLKKFLEDTDGEKKLNEIIKNTKIDEKLIENIRDEFKKLFSLPENKDKIILFDNIDEGLKDLNEMNYILGVLSNGTMKSLERDIGNLMHYFKFVISESDKPEPKMYLKALKELNIQPTEAIYVGDAISDIVMAKKAVSKSVALLSGMGLENYLKSSNPDYIFKDFNEFVKFVKTNGI